jgi:hypothetical protein
MSELEAIEWFKAQFGAAAMQSLHGTPFSLDMATAIAMQETYGDCWGLLYKTKTAAQVLPFCVGDTIDSPGRSAFPQNKSDLCQTPSGQQMFDIAHQALVNIGQYNPAYALVAKNPNKFCHGYGIFQYDIQFFRSDPDFFLQFEWYDFEQCLARLLKELNAALHRAYGANKATLNDDEMMYVAIAYNAGRVNVGGGPKQGYKDGSGKFYGENFQEFLQLAHTVPTPPQAQPSAAVAVAPTAIVPPAPQPAPSVTPVPGPPTVGPPPPPAAPAASPGTPAPAGQIDLISIIQQVSALVRAATAQASQQTTSATTIPALTAAQQLLNLMETTMAGTATPSATQSSPTASVTQSNLATLLPQILALVQSSTAQPLPSATTTPVLSQAQIQQIVSILNALAGSSTGQNVLGQVNGALGQTIGSLLDGKKSAIGILGATATAVLQAAGPTLAGSVPVVGTWAGLGSAAMPIFLAMAAWGALGKLEKWTQGSPPANT